MKSIVQQMVCFLGTGLVLTASGLQGAERTELKLWPKGLPADAKPVDADRATKLKAKNTIEAIAYVEEPTLTLYPPPTEKANGCAVVVCPGGGYNMLAWKKEGLEIAEWFNSFGVFAAVLKYRVPRRDRNRIHWEPLQDAQRAIRLVRRHASQWRIDPHRVGMLGFSAGGHLTIMAGTHFDEKTYQRVDNADDLSCRPDFLIPIYAAYLGDGYDDGHCRLGPLAHVTPRTPPTFLAVTWDDRARGAQAALLFVELKKAGVPAELHVFARGGHGYAIRPSPHPVATQWPKLCRLWLESEGWLRPRDK
ncbi:MAG TPA: alpha/beta hydrolase [Planctomycetaceae bacterium]|nr:alpha/beta hydrolase [Planctomycetaceae bacterium]